MSKILNTFLSEQNTESGILILALSLLIICIYGYVHYKTLLKEQKIMNIIYNSVGKHIFSVRFHRYLTIVMVTKWKVHFSYFPHNTMDNIMIHKYPQVLIIHNGRGVMGVKDFIEFIGAENIIKQSKGWNKR